MATESKIITPLNIDSLLGKVKNRIFMVGVELEGAWSQLPPNICGLHGDNSVFAGRTPGKEYAIGELPIGPALPGSPINKLIVENYPQKVNHTCGMHVHMSFHTLLHYGYLIVPEYQETMLYYLTRWAEEEKFIRDPEHHIWPRLRGENKFCTKHFWPDMQIKTKRKDFDRERTGNRYTAVHYCHRLKTIEIRVLPMMRKPSQAIAAVQQVVDITNACIYLLGKKEKKQFYNGKLELDSGIIYEESIEELL